MTHRSPCKPFRGAESTFAAAKAEMPLVSLPVALASQSMTKQKAAGTSAALLALPICLLSPGPIFPTESESSSESAVKTHCALLVIC